MNLSKNFSYTEAIASDTALKLGILNIPSSEVLAVMSHTAQRMEFVRAALGNSPIHVSSWFRCLELNLRLGSKPTSQHPKGEAVDFTCPSFGTPLRIVQHLNQLADIIDFNQLILEHTWVHISFNSDPTIKNKQQVLTLLLNGLYAIGITDKEGKAYA
jgi:zinc D-Ala-D-Ala carboxypeptidase